MSAEPRGVRLLLANGETVPCRCLRDPDLDEDGCAAWIAVPGTNPGAPVTEVLADVLPARSSLHVRLEGNGEP
ncbi:MAG: hypothetical protein FWE15_20960 [Actinomycetia bacterium]|nr:hypothetical protein [Actinomycetes bacterium]